ncbi:MAG: 3'-5' exonuclease [Oscillospiraceae bacterium]
MQYIVMDLEWNNAYSKKLSGFINEVIEIGAVKLDDELNVTDTFSDVVKSQVGKKLQGRVKALTHITNEEISRGIPFQKAISNFSKWLGEEENLFLTWGDGDIRTLIKNCEYFMGYTHIPFINNYCDLQKYCQSFIDSNITVQQVGLSAAAVALGINPDKFPHHRALDDSFLSVACFKKTFDNEKLKKYTHKCDNLYYEKLFFKPKIISDINNPLVDKTKFNCVCDVCGGKVKVKKDWRFINQSFRADFQCPTCKRDFKVCIRFKQYYDRLDVKKTFSEIVKADTHKITNKN